MAVFEPLCRVRHDFLGYHASWCLSPSQNFKGEETQRIQKLLAKENTKMSYTIDGKGGRIQP